MIDVTREDGKTVSVSLHNEKTGTSYTFVYPLKHEGKGWSNMGPARISLDIAPVNQQFYGRAAIDFFAQLVKRMFRGAKFRELRGHADASRAALENIERAGS